MSQTNVTVAPEAEKRESISLVTKIEIFVKQNWLLVLLACVAIWWFYFRDPDAQSAVPNAGDGARAVGAPNLDRLFRRNNLTTTPDGLRRFLY